MLYTQKPSLFMLYTLNLYSDVCQSFLKLGKNPKFMKIIQ